MRLHGHTVAVAAPLLAGATLVATTMAFGLSGHPANGPFGHGRSRVLASTGAPVPTPAPAAGSSPKAVTTINRFSGGAAVGGSQPWNARRSADFAAVRSAGLTWVRADIDWRFLETQRGQWDLPLYDSTVQDATAAGLRTLGILHTVPGWANGNAGDYAPPADPAWQTDFCYRALLHYVPLGVTAYEIGNEVNLPAPGRPKPNGKDYTSQFLVPCVNGIRKAVAETKVAVTIVLGSLVPTDDPIANPNTFLSDIYGARGRGYFNAVSLHPYTGADSPSISDKLTKVPDALYAVMTAHGDGQLLIWATEFGYPTAGAYSVSEATERDFVTPALTAWFAHAYTGPLFWYTVRDSGGATSADREQHFGLLRLDGTTKPAYAAVSAWFSKNR
jgi:hypothetical protein